MIFNAVACFNLWEDVYDYFVPGGIAVPFIPQKIEITRISVLSDVQVDEDEPADSANIYAIYLGTTLEPITEFTIDGTNYSKECHDYVVGNFTGITFIFKIIGLHINTSIGPNTEATVAFHLRFYDVA